MSERKWRAGMLEYRDRMPPLAPAEMSDEQRTVAEALIAGPRKGVKGPFVPLLRSPKLVDRLGKVGEYLRFDSALDARVSEFVMLLVAREWTNHFEWVMHVPLAKKAGIASEVIAAVRERRRPPGMADDEKAAYDFCDELIRTHGVSDATYEKAVRAFGEGGVIDLVSVAGYFALVSMVMNVAHTPPPDDASVEPLGPLPC